MDTETVCTVDTHSGPHYALIACRFCGAKNIKCEGRKVEEYRTAVCGFVDVVKYAVVCGDCESHGPVCRCEQEACAAWNGLPTRSQGSILHAALQERLLKWLEEESGWEYWQLGDAHKDLATVALEVFRQPTP